MLSFPYAADYSTKFLCMQPAYVSQLRNHQSTIFGTALCLPTYIRAHMRLVQPHIRAMASIDDVAENQRIKIRRRPLTGPPQHYVGPFEFRLENEGNTPRNIMEKIIWNKNVEVSKLREVKPLYTLKKSIDNAPPTKDFIGTLKESYQKTGLPALIAEVQKASPSRGVLQNDFDPVGAAKVYEKSGAACLSVLTDERFFQGSFEHLKLIHDSGVQCPLLCREFIIDAWQIFYARLKGADAISLIAAVLPDVDLKYLTKICRMLGLAALVEVQNEWEMDRVLGIDGIKLIGINNRNFETFEMDTSIANKLLEGKRGEIILERGITVVEELESLSLGDAAYVPTAGIQAVLVSNPITKKADP